MSLLINADEVRRQVHCVHYGHAGLVYFIEDTVDEEERNRISMRTRQALAALRREEYEQ